MESQSISQLSPLDPDTTVLSLTERHLNEWLQLLDYLQDTYAPTDELAFCRGQIIRLQRELYQLGNKPTNDARAITNQFEVSTPYV